MQSDLMASFPSNGALVLVAIVFLFLSQHKNKAANQVLEVLVTEIEHKAAAAAQKMARDVFTRLSGVLRRSGPITPDRCCNRLCAGDSRPMGRPLYRTYCLCLCGSLSLAHLRCESCCEREDSVSRTTVQAGEESHKNTR